jgi:hypothetical protein
MDALDQALCGAWRLSVRDFSDEVESELERLLPALIKAGYVHERGHSPTGSFSAFTEDGVKRAKELGCD